MKHFLGKILLLLISAIFVSVAQGSDCIFTQCSCTQYDTDEYNVVCSFLSAFPSRNRGFNHASITFGVVTFRNNSFSTIPDSVFDGLRIKSLEFRNNKLERLSKNSFVGIAGLSKLVIRDSSLVEMDNATFRPISNLNGLQLSNLKPELVLKFFRCCLQPLNKLKYLHLDANQLVSLDRAIISYFTNLEIIDLSSNRISNLTNLFSVLTPIQDKLEELNLDNNLIDDLVDFPSFPKLEQVQLARNKIRVIKESTFKRLTGLEYLDLGRNFLSNISDRAFSGATYISKLNLEHNYISKVPNISDLVHLTDLNLLNQNGMLKRIDNYAFQRSVQPSAKLALILALNDLTLDKKAFCTEKYAPSLVDRVALSYSTIKNADKCQFLQFIPETRVRKSRIILLDPQQSARDFSDINNCSVVGLLNKYSIHLLNFTKEINDECSAHSFVDDCVVKSEYKCPNYDYIRVQDVIVSSATAISVNIFSIILISSLALSAILKQL